MENEKLQRIELTLDNELFNTVNLISLVLEPAVEQNFMFFSKVENKMKFSVDKEKMEITGCAMRANFDIYRYNFWTGEEYNVFFSEETVRKCMTEFMSWSNNRGLSIEHNCPLKDTVLVESWQVVDVEIDKAKALGFNNITKGDWYITVKVSNPEVWDILKTSTRGFSIEGFFTEIMDSYGKEIEIDDADISDEQAKMIIDAVVEQIKNEKQ